MDDLKQIGKRLAQYLKQKNIGVNELGRMSGTSGAQISFMIKGKNFGIDKLLKVIKVCKDLNVNWLLFGKEMVAETNEASSSEESKEKTLLMKKLETLKAEILNMTHQNDLKDLLIENLKSNLELSQQTNKDLKEMLGFYQKLLDKAKSA